MKKLFLLLPLLLVGCAVEEDTRLVCDCDYVVQDFEKEDCYSDSYDVNNNSLVINISKRKFSFNGFDYPEGDGTHTFEDNYVSFKFDTEVQKFYQRFDRVSLVFYETKQNIDKYIEDKYPLWKPSETTYYQCRIVEGV